MFLRFKHFILVILVGSVKFTRSELEFLPKLPAGKQLLWTKGGNMTTYMPWTNRLDDFIDEYKTAKQDAVVQDCSYGRRVEPGIVCNVNLDGLFPCTSANRFNYHRNAPCVFLRLNEAKGWKPEYYNNTKNLPSDMPFHLRKLIRTLKAKSPKELNTVWVSCEGETPADKENIGPVFYLPRMGFPDFYFPYKTSEDYLQPVVAVLFEKVIRGVAVSVVCKAWARNLDDSVESRDTFHFFLLVE